MRADSVQRRMPDDLRSMLTRDEDILAVMLFGSAARGESFSDIDLCLILSGSHDNLSMSRKRLEYLALADDRYDMHIFQQLPLQVRMRVIREGETLIVKDEDALYDLAFQTVKEFEHFHRIQSEYLEGVHA